MDNCNKIAALYIASLRGLSIIFQQNHWLTNGIAFYGDHLLLERLYKSTIEDLDLIAEKFVGLFGDECLDYELQTNLLSKVLSKYKDFEGSPLEQSLTATKDCIKLSSDAYKSFESENKLSLGCDDALMAISSNLETAVYLLQQVLKGN